VTVDFKNTIIILTSNIGSSKIIEISDREARKSAVMNELKVYFRPEFLNRLDDIIIFEQLGLEAITKIVDLMFGEINKKVAEKGITLVLTEKARAYIADAGFDPVFGARPLKRALYEIVEDKLAGLILEEKLHEGNSVIFDENHGEIIVSINE